MFKKEAGYVLPTTIIVIFIFSALLISQVQSYVTDKQFLEAQMMIFQNEQLLQAAAVDLKAKSYEQLLLTTSLHYELGTVYCESEPLNDTLVKVIMQAHSLNGGLRFVHLIVDTSQGAITEWSEVTR